MDSAKKCFHRLTGPLLRVAGLIVHSGRLVEGFAHLCRVLLQLRSNQWRGCEGRWRTSTRWQPVFIPEQVRRNATARLASFPRTEEVEVLVSSKA